MAYSSYDECTNAVTTDYIFLTSLASIIPRSKFRDIYTLPDCYAAWASDPPSYPEFDVGCNRSGVFIPDILIIDNAGAAIAAAAM
jgi:hypothetical protein